MKKTFATLAGIGIAAGAFIAAPAAHADGLGGISGWEPSPLVCGTQNQIPIVITNETQWPQTGSITVPAGLSANVQIFSNQYDMQNAAQGCARDEIQAAPSYSNNFTVQPGQTTTFWAALGGVDMNAIGNSHNIGFGGLPSGYPGAGWYDMNLSLTATESFGGLQVNYDGTGGTNGNNQAGFNLVSCGEPYSSLPYGSVLTPYSSRDVNGPYYGTGDPICAAWLVDGNFVPGGPDMNLAPDVQAVQTYTSGGNEYLAIAGQSTTTPTYISGAITSVTAVYDSGETVALSEGSGPGSGNGGFWQQNADGTYVIGAIPLLPNANQVWLVFNGYMTYNPFSYSNSADTYSNVQNL